jgi:hypothetical protein
MDEGMMCTPPSRFFVNPFPPRGVDLGWGLRLGMSWGLRTQGIERIPRNLLRKDSHGGKEEKVEVVILCFALVNSKENIECEGLHCAEKVTGV